MTTPVGHNRANGPFRGVATCEEEWRTGPGGNGRARAYGRVCLWIRLVCGHYVQRMQKLRADGSYDDPTRARCSDCG